MNEKKFEKAKMQSGNDERAQDMYGMGDQGTEEQARRFLLAGQMKRVQAAQEEVEAVYAKHRVGLDVYMIVRPNGTIVQAQFVPQEGWAGDPSGLVAPNEG